MNEQLNPPTLESIGPVPVLTASTRLQLQVRSLTASQWHPLETPKRYQPGHAKWTHYLLRPPLSGSPFQDSSTVSLSFPGRRALCLPPAPRTPSPPCPVSSSVFSPSAPTATEVQNGVILLGSQDISLGSQESPAESSLSYKNRNPSLYTNTYMLTGHFCRRYVTKLSQ